MLGAISMTNLSKSTHILELAKELIDDIELQKTNAQAMLLKATRLSRYADNDETRSWLRFEMQGFSSNDETSLKYMSKTGRWTEKKENKGYWMPLAEIEANISTQSLKIKQLRIPDTQGLNTSNIVTQISTTAKLIAKLEGIKSRVISLIHDFATSVYYEKIFDNLAESIFDEYKKEVDLLIAENSGDIIQQIPSVISRLSDGDTESISQALTTCRRIIDNFADKIFPPSDDTIEIGGNTLSLKVDKTLNRLNAYVHQKTSSDSRKKKIRQNLSNLYDRVSTGVHSDVTASEARNLFFNVYLILGEILAL